MKKIGEIQFDNRTLDIYGTAGRPCFIAADVADLLGYSASGMSKMLKNLEKDESFKTLLVSPTPCVKASYQTVIMVSELGLYNILSQSPTPTARLWRRALHQEIINLRKFQGKTIEDRFQEWDEFADSFYIDPKTGILMQSITVAGGDVEQVPYGQ